MFAKRFFYSCAGLLCLALAYHLGASNATAKQPSNLEGPAMEWFAGPGPGTLIASGVVGRQFYQFAPYEGYPPPITAPIPGTDPIVATNPLQRSVMLANGDLYAWGVAGAAWTKAGNLFGTP